MSKELLDIYSGNQPYIFVSYSHRDEDAVFPLVREMQQRGYRVWLDRGIEVGTEWSNNIADRLRRCETVIFFVSKNSVASENCLDEVSFAKSHKKPAILIYLEENVMMPEGVEMQTARFQRMYATRHADAKSVVSALETAPILEPCRDLPTPAPETAPAPAPQPAVGSICPYCGASVRDNSKFCDVCGKPLQESAPVAVSAPAETPAPAPTPVPAAEPKKSLIDKWKEMPKKTKIILGVIAAVVVLCLLGKLIATIVEPLEDAPEDTRVYMMVDIMNAFEAAGYETEVVEENMDWGDDAPAEMQNASMFDATRTTDDGFSDYVRCAYMRCLTEEDAKALYDELLLLVSDVSTYDERHLADYVRMVYGDSISGVCGMISLHDNVVVMTAVDYSEFTDTYDHKPEDVLRSVNF